MTTQHENQNILPITRRVAGLSYALFALACIPPLWPLFLVGLGLKLYWQDRARGSWLESHFEWQKNSLLVGIAAIASAMAISSGILGLINMPDSLHSSLSGLASIIVALAIAWLAIRMVSGWRTLHRFEPMGKSVAQRAEIAAAEENPTLKSAARSLNITVLFAIIAANIASLMFVLDGIDSLTGQGDAVMGLIYMAVWYGWAILGTILYGVFLVTFWISLPDKKQAAGGRLLHQSIIVACLVMMLINGSSLLL